jgi:hypothetical protein
VCRGKELGGSRERYRNQIETSTQCFQVLVTIRENSDMIQNKELGGSFIIERKHMFR